MGEHGVLRIGEHGVPRIAKKKESAGTCSKKKREVGTFSSATNSVSAK